MSEGEVGKKGQGGGHLVRVSTALVLLPSALALVWLPEGAYGALKVAIAAAALVAAYEYAGLLKARGITGAGRTAIIASTAVAFSGGFAGRIDPGAVLFAACALVCAVHVFRGDVSISSLSASVFGVVYTGWFPAHFLMLHAAANGTGLITLLIVAVIFTDSGAYFVGKKFGKHKLAPVVSPNKTWEGAFGGFAFAIAAVLGLHVMYNAMEWEGFADWSLYRCAMAAALISITAQIGDLTESILKRDAGVKDSGTIFPGHGGALDRFDGFLFATPVLYYIAVF
jgi:phosphatidate cytidylyltransferase